MKTLEIGDYAIALQQGKQYRASRPMAQLRMKDFPVTITDMDNGQDVLTIGGLTYNEANDFINQFNNGATSFEGRRW